MKYTMTLKDGTCVEFSGVNGNNFIVPNQEAMDVSIFTDSNLRSGKVADEEGTEYPFTNLAFIQQQKQRNGDYYICFWEKTEEELAHEEQEQENIDVELAIIELYSLIENTESLAPVYADLVMHDAIEMTSVPEEMQESVNSVLDERGYLQVDDEMSDQKDSEDKDDDGNSSAESEDNVETTPLNY